MKVKIGGVITFPLVGPETYSNLEKSPHSIVKETVFVIVFPSYFSVNILSLSVVTTVWVT